MQKLLTLIVFLLFSVIGYSQSNTQVVQQNAISNVSDLPESLKGEIPANFPTDMLAELLEMQAIVTRTGEIHPTILDNPRVLAEAILSNAALDAAFREYITTASDSTRDNREEELLDIY